MTALPPRDQVPVGSFCTPWTLRSLVLLATLLVGGAGCFAGDQPVDVEDLTLIPADGRGFLSVRVADVWNTPRVQLGVGSARVGDFKIAGPAVHTEKAFGLKPDEVERVSVVYSSDGLVWGIVRTLEPYDRKKLRSRLQGAKPAVHQGKLYHTGTDKQGRAAAVWLASPRVAVVGSEEGVKSCIGLAARPVSKGPLQPIIAMCKGKRHAVAGIDGKRLDGLKGNLLLSWVSPVQLAWATIDVDKQVELSIHARAADEEQAKKVHRNAAVAVALTPEFLASKIDVEVASQLSFALGEVKVRRDGREVIAKLAGGAGDLISTLVLWFCGSPALDEDVLLKVRSPFGEHRVEEGPTTRDGYRYDSNRLRHGSTMSAKQFTGWVSEVFRDPDTKKIVYGPRYFAPGVRDTPLAYYHKSGPVGQVFRAYNTDPKRAFAVLDMGAGTMASYGLPGQVVDFYERDRELARIAFDTAVHFTFVENAQSRGVDVNLVLGEPRSTFARAGTARRLKPLGARKGNPVPPRKFGLPMRGDLAYRLILVDMLGPDSIPGHLTSRITREAVKGYFDRLEENGIVLIHISSRYFDLPPVLANIADDLGVIGYHLSDDDNAFVGKNRSHWVALTRKPEYMAKVLTVPRWTRDPDQLAFLGVTVWPTGGSAALQALAGMGHLGQTLTNLQAQMAGNEEGRAGNPQWAIVEWEPLETTKELRRIETAGPKEIRELTARIEARRKERDGAGRNSPRKTWLDARIASLERTREALESKVQSAAAKIRRNAKVGVWTDESSDLIERFVR